MFYGYEKGRLFYAIRLLFFRTYGKIHVNSQVDDTQMKKLILKTALITLGVTIIVAVSLFGILSFCAPASMMRFFDSLGLENISGDYAYQEYQNSKDIAFLVRAFEVAAEHKNDSVADARFTELCGEAGSEQRKAFYAYCEKRNKENLPAGVPDYDYRAYLFGRAACVKYRLATTEEEFEAVADFAIGYAQNEEGGRLSVESPVVVLAIEAIDAGDGRFCIIFLNKLEKSGLDRENAHFERIVNFLKEAANE